MDNLNDLSEFCCDNPNLTDIQDAISDFTEKIILNRFESITAGSDIFVPRMAVSLAVSDVLAEINR